jgi:hypothetical protein
VTLNETKQLWYLDAVLGSPSCGLSELIYARCGLINRLLHRLVANAIKVLKGESSNVFLVHD